LDQARFQAAPPQDHALSLPVCSNPVSSEEVETLAREIAGPDANAETQHLARQIAEAQIDLRRVRYARHKLLSDALADPHYDGGREAIAVLRNLLRKNAPDLPVENLVAFVNSAPQGPNKFATILSQQAKQLLAMDRYERERYPVERPPFEPLMKHADGRLIAVTEHTTYSCITGRTKPKCRTFSMPGENLGPLEIALLNGEAAAQHSSQFLPPLSPRALTTSSDFRSNERQGKLRPV